MDMSAVIWLIVFGALITAAGVAGGIFSADLFMPFGEADDRSEIKV
jgi:hypothetical protein